MNPPESGTRRRRAGHKSCEACQAIKLRCVREIRDLPCNRCRTHELRCRLPDRPPRKLRTGRRIELAKTLYGESDIASTRANPAPFSFRAPAVCHLIDGMVTDTSEVDGYGLGVVDDVIWSAESSSSSWSSSPASSSAFQRVGLIKTDGSTGTDLTNYYHDNSIISDEVLSRSWTDMFYISEYSVESVLASVELCGELSSHLIEEWFDTCPFAVPVSRWKDFRVQFDEAGRTPITVSYMHELTQTPKF